MSKPKGTNERVLSCVKGRGSSKAEELRYSVLHLQCEDPTASSLPWKMPSSWRLLFGSGLPPGSSDLFQFYTLLSKTLTTRITGKQLYKKNALGKLYFPQKNLQEKWISTRLFLPCFPSSTTNVNFVQ